MPFISEWGKYFIMVCYCTPLPSSSQCHQVGALKLATVGVFTPQKSADTTNQDLIS